MARYWLRRYFDRFPEALTGPVPGSADIVREHDLDANKTIFVDDSPANVQAARALGLHAILFEDAGGLRAELQALGVLG